MGQPHRQLSRNVLHPPAAGDVPWTQVRDEGGELRVRVRPWVLRSRVGVVLWVTILGIAVTTMVLVPTTIWVGLLWIMLALRQLVSSRGRVTPASWAAVGIVRRSWRGVLGVVRPDVHHPCVAVRLRSGRDVDTGIPGEWAWRVAEIGAVPLLDRFSGAVYTGVLPDPKASHGVWAPPHRARTP